MWNQPRLKWIAAALLLLVLTGTTTPALAARKKKHAAAKKNAAPVVSRAQMELAQQMARNSYALGRGLEVRQRVALMTRLLYTMSSEVMPAEKREWAAELFRLGQQLPVSDDAEASSSRNAVIATAAARLAIYDADEALELLDSLPAEAGGNRADARTMAARLVFAGYMQHHSAAGAQTLLAHGRRWSEQGEFPYSASATALARLRPNEDAAEDYFRQVLAIFVKGHEGLYGVSDFASLLQQAAAMEGIFEDTAEEAGRAVIGQLRKFTETESTPLTEEQKQLVTAALNNVRISAPKAYEEARKSAPELLAVRAQRLQVQVEIPKVDPDLQSAFHDLADAMRARSGPDALHTVIAHGVQVVNSKYKAGACANCYSPDAQSWALVSLAAYAAPTTIATQLNGIEDPFWHAYFLAIAAQQVGQPTRVADPTARKVPGKEEAEPE